MENVFGTFVSNASTAKDPQVKYGPVVSTETSGHPKGRALAPSAPACSHGLAKVARGLFWLASMVVATSQAAPLEEIRAQRSSLSSFSVSPTRILWQSPQGVKNANHLLKRQPGQVMLSTPTTTELKAAPGHPAGVLLDFGAQLQGYVEIFTPSLGEDSKPRQIRVRFGESANEAMAELGGSQHASNVHAIRDQIVTLPWMGKITIGPSGFRFVRLDNIDPALPVEISEIRAILQIRDIPYLGSFKSSDERLNRIWEVGAYTVHLNMQDYLWDGIKRDRLVWIGDMHPEVSTIEAVFGFNDIVPQSLDLIRDVTPAATDWMNGIPSYSMWWVLLQEEVWMHQGDRAYLEAQRAYLQPLLRRLAALIGPDGREQIQGFRFLDWPSQDNPKGATAGLQALLVMTLESGARLMTTLDDPATAEQCRTAAKRGRRVVPDANGFKSGAALLVLADMVDAKKTADGLLKVGGPQGISTFYGFYVLQALAKAGEIDAALEMVRRYWGGMLDMGATCFWEEFDIAWIPNASPIDELVPEGKKGIHGDYGAYDHKGFNNSLCHGWASGPTAWLSQTVLGIRPLEPGFKRVSVAPQLGRLKWAEGTYPTPLGPIHVRHERQADGTVQSKINAPQGMRVDGERLVNAH